MNNLIMIGAGLLFFCIGAGLLYKWERFRFGARKTKGTIIGHWGKRTKDDGNYLYAPIVQFYDQATGQLWTFQTPSYTSLKRRTGSTIAVAYRPENPQQANIDTIGQRLIPLIVMLMGAAAFIIALKVP